MWPRSHRPQCKLPDACPQLLATFLLPPLATPPLRPLALRCPRQPVLSRAALLCPARPLRPFHSAVLSITSGTQQLKPLVNARTRPPPSQPSLRLSSLRVLVQLPSRRKSRARQPPSCLSTQALKLVWPRSPPLLRLRPPRGARSPASLACASAMLRTRARLQSPLRSRRL